jgi:hypothetical protein
MLKYMTIFAALVILPMVSTSLAETIQNPNDVLMTPAVDWLAKQTAPGSNREVVGAAEFRLGSGSPEQSLLAAIVNWLSSNFDLPATSERPFVKIVPPSEIAALRYGALLFAQTPNGPTLTRNADNSRTVVAVYNDRTRTILLPKGWTGTTPAELSVLVHEMVHHLQNMAGLKFECPQAREKVAFFAQERWLRMFGSDLPYEFGIDPFTLLVRTNCAY